MSRISRPFLVAAAWLLAASAAAAQTFPSGPLTLAAGRVVFGGDVAASFAPDDPGFFNYSDYEHSTLRALRIGLTASVRATDHVSFLGELRSENFDGITPFALYARIRPWRERRLDIQVGRIPPTFGAFTRRAYGHLNPVIGYPLAYQYLTSLRPDAMPATPDELLRMRARGWRSAFSIGNTAPARGLPLVTAFAWDTGVQVRTGWRRLEVTTAVTNGSASNPRVGDDNSGKQLAARAELTPATGLILGASFARGEFMHRAVAAAVSGGDTGAFVQTAYGLDAEYSRDRWIVRAEAVGSRWRLAPSPAAALPVLFAGAVSVEGRYTILPGFYAAARADHLGFSQIRGRTRTAEWDAPVSRLEAGGGFYVMRNLVARATIQFNRRSGGRIRQARLPAVQLLYWF